MMNGEGFSFGNLDDWRSDPVKCKQGVPFDLGKGRALIVRRANVHDREIQAHFRKVDWHDEQARKEVYARVLVVDWRGIVNLAGDPVPYSPDACLALFNYAPDIWEELEGFAINRANYALEVAQEDSEALKSLRDGAQVQAPTAHS